VKTVGEAVLEDLLGVDFKKGIHKSEVEDRAYQYGSNKKAEVPLKCMKHFTFN